jgi:hypothetical protein
MEMKKQKHSTTKLLSFTSMVCQPRVLRISTIKNGNEKTISMEYVDTTANTADQLTKPLTGTPFLLGRQSLMGPQRTKATT